MILLLLILSIPIVITFCAWYFIGYGIWDCIKLFIKYGTSTKVDTHAKVVLIDADDAPHRIVMVVATLPQPHRCRHSHHIDGPHGAALSNDANPMVVQHLRDLAFMASHGTSMPSPPKKITDDAHPGRGHTTEGEQRDQGPPDDHSDDD